MIAKPPTQPKTWLLLLILTASLLLGGCRGNAGEQSPGTGAAAEAEDAARLTLPDLAPTEHEGRPLAVVATSSIIGDVVGTVGGDAIALATLIRAGQDPHSYQPSTGDLAAVADADVIFVNGWSLEEGILGSLENMAGVGPVVPISAGITPRTDGGQADPHVWLNPEHVMQWTRNVQTVLGALDPENAPRYQENAAAYLERLADLADFLETETAKIPETERLLVTNHDSLGYFAERYGFTIVGTVIPGTSTGAEPSAREMAALAQMMSEAGVCTIFLEGTANTSLAEAIAAEVDGCQQVAVRELYTGALGPAGSTPGSYTGMMRTNMGIIADGLLAEGDS